MFSGWVAGPVVVMLATPVFAGHPAGGTKGPGSDTASANDVELRAGSSLEPDGKGGYRWKGDGFSAAIAPDGGVTFQDAKPLPAQTAIPVQALGQAIREGSTPPSKATGPALRGGGGATAGGGAGRGSVLGILQKTAVKLVTNPTLAVSDSELVSDNHHAAKMDFLDRTATLRKSMRAEFDRKTTSGALGRLRSQVQVIANDERRSVKERHQLIFELWEECDESAGGLEARAAIEREAARQHPAGTASGYTVEELAKLNGDHKSPRFSPYQTEVPLPRSP